MTISLLRRTLQDSIERPGVAVSEFQFEQLATYIELLARWNRKMNLTAFNLERPTSAALEKLIVEPLQAAAYVPPSATCLVDIGSGGGSPAVPILVICNNLKCILVESVQKKAVFLREAIGTLELPGSVEPCRFSEVVPHVIPHSVDIVTMRAVRGGLEVWAGVGQILKPDGAFIWFADASQVEAERPGLEALMFHVEHHDDAFAVLKRHTMA